MISGGTQVRVPLSDESEIAVSRTTARRLAEAFHFDEVSVSRVAIIATELATNIVRHARRGEMLIQVLDDGVTAELEVLAIDQGPGMHDVDECMEAGYSSTGSAGEGLGNVMRLSNTFDVFSLIGKGAVVLSRTERKRNFARQERRQSPLEIGAICVPAAGALECGDIWRVAEEEACVSVMVAAGVGHGPQAAAAAKKAAAAFDTQPFADPATSMTLLHRVLTGSGGATAACARLNPAALGVSYAGIGNINGTVVTRERLRSMRSCEGTLGVSVPQIRSSDYEWPLGSRVILHTAGLAARWSVAAYAGLHLRHSAIVAAVLYRDFVRRRDDATVVVACHRRPQ